MVRRNNRMAPAAAPARAGRIIMARNDVLMQHHRPLAGKKAWLIADDKAGMQVQIKSLFQNWNGVEGLGSALRLT